MSKLFLLRHFKSQWNFENRFTGWVDVPLMEGQDDKIKKMSKMIFKNKIDIIYSSPLFRNQNSVAKILDYVAKYPIFIHLDKGRMERWGGFKKINKKYVPVYISENLNERYYGSLQGLYKPAVIKKYGAKKTHMWRRAFNYDPPGGGEGLDEVYRRAVPFFKKFIEKDLKKGKYVLVVASHNSLRALIKYIEKISDKEIINVEVDYGGLIKYEFDKSLKMKNKKIITITQ